MAEDALISIAAAEALVADAMRASGASPHAAQSVARALVGAEADGQPGHGFSRVAAYAAQALAGKVAGAAEPEARAAGEAFLSIDAAHGFAYPAIDLVIDRLPPLAARTGIAGAAIVRSHHCGQLGAHVERLAERGLAAIMVANAPKAIAPWGGSEPFFGTNPIAFAAPIAGAAPLVIDLSLSKVARGKVMAAAKDGRAIPEGWALDPEGRPTTDPEAALAGTMVPAGEAKGAALALMVEVLAATLIDATPSHQASSFFNAEGPPPGVGQLIIAFDPERVCATGGFAERLAARARAQAEGVRISAKMKAEIEAIARRG